MAAVSHQENVGSRYAERVVKFLLAFKCGELVAERCRRDSQNETRCNADFILASDLL